MLMLSTMLTYARARFGEMQAREEGVTAVEYALMVAIVVLLLVVGFYFLFQQVSAQDSAAGRCVAAVPATPPSC